MAPPSRDGTCETIDGMLDVEPPELPPTSDLANMVQALPMGALVTDRDGRVLFANPEAKRVLASERFVGTPSEWGERCELRTATGEPLPLESHPIVRALAGEVVRDEWTLRKGDGEVKERWLSISTSPIQDATQAAAVMTISDVTERQRTIRELEEFAYVASHDLQEPLRTVRSFMTLLQEEHTASLDAAGQEYVKFAHDGAERMSILVSDLLLFSRSGAEPISKQPIALSDIVAEVLEEQRSAMQSCGATATVGALPMVTADRAQLLNVVRSLLSNALKFRHPDRPPVVRVSATAGEHDTLIEIEDNGIGFESRFAKKVFRIFQRLNARSKFAGTGIGLAICKRAVERHGGAIGARSEPGSGSVFWFTLPNNATR